MKQLKWRMKELPTVEEINKLLEAGVITKDEMRTIFFKDDEEPSSTALQEVKDELELIRTMITNVQSPTVIYRDIERYIDRFPKSPWIAPYATWLTTGGTTNLPTKTTYIA